VLGVDIDGQCIESHRCRFSSVGSMR
jgi:hypothetical protein